MVLVYKYIDINGSKAWLENKSIVYAEPSFFGDPFDSRPRSSKRNVAVAAGIVKNAALLSFLVSVGEQIIRNSKKDTFQIKMIKKEIGWYKSLVDKANKTGFYRPNVSWRVFDHICRVLLKKGTEQFEAFLKIESSFDQLSKDLDAKICQSLNEGRDLNIVSSFTDDYRNPTMWQNYANGHNGICVAYDSRAFQQLKKVSYKNRSFLSVKKLAPYLIPYVFFGKAYSENKKLESLFLQSFYSKGAGLSREREYRSVVSKDTKSAIPMKGMKGHYLIKPMSGPVSVYIGCRTSQEDIVFIGSTLYRRGIPCYLENMDRYENKSEWSLWKPTD